MAFRTRANTEGTITHIHTMDSCARASSLRLTLLLLLARHWRYTHANQRQQRLRGGCCDSLAIKRISGAHSWTMAQTWTLLCILHSAHIQLRALLLATTKQTRCNFCAHVHKIDAHEPRCVKSVRCARLAHAQNSCIYVHSSANASAQRARTAMHSLHATNNTQTLWSFVH